MDNSKRILIVCGKFLAFFAIVAVGVIFCKNWIETSKLPEHLPIEKMDNVEMQLFNNWFYRYGDDGDMMLGFRAKELVEYANEVSVKVYGIVSDYVSGEGYLVSYSYDEAGYINGVTLTAVDKR